MPGPSQPISVLSTLGIMGVVRGLLTQAEAAGFDAEFRFDPSAPLLAAVKAGTRANIAILVSEAIEELLAEGILAQGTRKDLARSFVGVAVRAGAPRPEISTAEAFRAALLAAPSIAYSRAGASGIFFAGLIERLGIAAEINAKARIIPRGLTAELAASGEATLAIQQVSELMAVPGVDIVGPLPRELNTAVTFTAATFYDAPQRARELVSWLASAMTPEVLAAGGLKPA